MIRTFGVVGSYEHFRLWAHRVLDAHPSAIWLGTQNRLLLPGAFVAVWAADEWRLRDMRLAATLKLADLLGSDRPLDLLTARPERAEEEKP